MTLAVKVDKMKNTSTGHESRDCDVGKKQQLNGRIFDMLTDEDNMSEELRGLLSRETLGGKVQEIWPGCAYIAVEMDSGESAKNLRKKVANGELQSEFQLVLVTEELKREFRLSEVTLEVSLEDWEYQMCVQDLTGESKWNLIWL